jgi:hypothetical protein
MSWNVSGIGTKAAVKKQIESSLDPMIASTKGIPNEKEYSAAKSALAALVDSAPDGAMLSISSWGSAGYGDSPFFDVKVELKAVVPTLKE